MKFLGIALATAMSLVVAQASAQTPTAAETSQPAQGPRVIAAPPVRPSASNPAMVGPNQQVQQNQGFFANQAPQGQSGALPPNMLPPAMRAELEASTFKEALQSVIPLTEEQIRTGRRTIDDSTRAMLEPTRPQPKRVLRSEQITLEAGKPPPMLRVTAGRASALTFRDATGAAWPIDQVLIGSQSAFNVEAFGPDSSMVGVTPLQPVINSNMIVRLRNLHVPVLVEVETNDTEVDGRLDVLVLSRGPLSRPSLVETTRGLEPGNAAIVAFLDGVPPSGSRRLNVSGFAPNDTSAWLYQGSVFLRTSAQVLSPAALSTVRSADDRIAVYEMPEVPVVILSDSGQMGSARLQERPVLSEANQ